MTKCSDYWNLVLIEIEEPKKKTFLKDSEYIKFTAEFNNAYDQVLSWKAYLEEDNNTAELRKRVRKLMGDSPIANIPFYVKYVLIYGRKIEKQNSEKRIRMFNQKNTAEIHVMNFDSLISEYESKPPSIIVCSRKLVALILQGFSIFQNHVFTSTFPSHFVTFLFCTLSRYYKISHFFLKNY